MTIDAVITAVLIITPLKKLLSGDVTPIVMLQKE